MSTGKLKENYDVPNGGKSASGIYTDYAPDLLYTDAYIDGVNASAVFHDQSEVYLSGGKTAAEAVTLYLRTAKGDISSASVVIKGYGAKFSETSEVQMTLSRSDDRFDYYSAALTASAENRYYAFSLEKDGKTLYYTTYGLTASDPGNTAYNYFILTPGFETPAWSQGTVYYSIFPDSFFNGDALNDAGKSSYSGATARPWGTARTGYLYPNVARATGLDYYGGDLAGIYSKIGYLKNTLGVETVYTNPIFDATFNVGYGPDDFLTVSKYYGTNRELSALISALHENGMRFITDGVWLYSTANSKQYNKSGYWPESGAYQSENTPFKDFYVLEKNKTWPNVKTVYSESVFKINFESDYTKNIIFRNKDSALLYFLAAPYNMDGWRLDVPAYNASSTNGYEIMSGFREYMKKVNPESVLIGETTVLPEERQGTALDSVWNYEDFAGPVYGFFGAPRNKPGDESTGNPVYKSFTASELLTKLYQSAAKVPYVVAKSEFNLLASHDTARVLTNLGSVEKAEIAAAVQFTYIGSPSLYYGDEIGLEGHSACFGDMGSFPWDESKWNYELLGTYRTLIKLRSDHENVMRHGGFMPLTSDDASSVFAYARYNADDAVILAVNGGSERKTVEIPVYKLGLDEPVYNLYNYVTGEIYPVKDGKINVRLGGESFAAIVKDKSRGEYDGKYLSLDIGTPDSTGGALKDGEKITLCSAGTLFDGVDNFRIFGEKAFGAFTVSADVFYENSGVMIRESDSPSSPFVAVIFKDKKKAVLCVREYEGGSVKEVVSTEFPIQDDSFASYEAGSFYVTFIIERGADNSFTAYIIDENGKREIGKTCVALKNGVYAGVFGALTGKKPNGPLPLVFKNFSVAPSATPLCDDFKSPVPAAVYAVLPDVLARTVGENGLELHPVSGLVRQMAALPEGDVSVTVLTAKSEADAGAVLYQDERNYVKLTRSP
ncbi:MAG: alpha amylase N-terminal ig-like domain-containing protein, partial [Clostridia bacterium]|nr:alpha amylase N-terminal ig-like domain-containing protein [Clostridia bacterium]